MESFKSKQSGDSGICLKETPQSDNDETVPTTPSQPDGLVMKPSTESTDTFDESSLKNKLKNASNLIKKISDNQFTANKKQLTRGTSQPDLLADLGVER